MLHCPSFPQLFSEGKFHLIAVQGSPHSGLSETMGIIAITDRTEPYGHVAKPILWRGRVRHRHRHPRGLEEKNGTSGTCNFVEN